MHSWWPSTALPLPLQHAAAAGAACISWAPDAVEKASTAVTTKADTHVYTQALGSMLLHCNQACEDQGQASDCFGPEFTAMACRCFSIYLMQKIALVCPPQANEWRASTDNVAVVLTFVV